MIDRCQQVIQLRFRKPEPTTLTRHVGLPNYYHVVCSAPTSWLGIDLGTSHTVAVVKRPDGRIEPLLFESSPLLPSAVFAPADGSLLVGRDALDFARTDPAALEPNPKRRIDDGSVLLGTRDVPVGDLFGAILSRVHRECVQVLGGEPDVVVVTHPAVWGSARRLVLQEAATAAGLGSPRLVPEPVAAAGYYAQHLEHDLPVGSNVVVHDFGGGTFDAAVVRRTAAGFEVLSVDGLDDLGGVDIDVAIIGHLRDRFADRPELWQQLLEPRNPGDRRLWRSFADDVRSTKERLSRHSSADLHLPLFDTDVHLTRTELEELTRPMLDRAVRLVTAVIRSAAQPDEANAGLFLVGGASRMPLVATMLHQALGTAPVVVDQLEQVVAHGALLVAMNLPDSPSMPMVSPYVSPMPTSPAQVSPTSAPPAPVPSPLTPPPAPVGSAGTGPVTTPPAGYAPVAAPPAGFGEVRIRKSARLPSWIGWAAAALVMILVIVLITTVFTGDDTDGGDDRTGPGTGGFGDSAEQEQPGAPDISYSGHEYSIDNMEIVDIDGRAAVVSGAVWDPIKVWDAATGVDIAEFDGHDETADTIGDIDSITLDGRTVMVSVGWGSQVLVWDPATGEQLRDIPVPDRNLVNMLATGYLDDTPVVAGGMTGGFDGERRTEVYLWEVDTGKQVGHWSAPVDSGTLTMTTLDGQLVVGLAGLDGSDPEEHVMRWCDAVSGDRVNSVALDGDADEVPFYVLAASTSDEPSVTVTGMSTHDTSQVWDAAGEPLVTTSEQAAAAQAVDVINWNGRTVAVVADDHDEIHVWDTATGESIAEYSFEGLTAGSGFNASGVTSVALGVVDGRLVVAAAAFIYFTVFTWSVDPD